MADDPAVGVLRADGSGAGASGGSHRRGGSGATGAANGHMEAGHAHGVPVVRLIQLIFRRVLVTQSIPLCSPLAYVASFMS